MNKVYAYRLAAPRLREMGYSPIPLKPGEKRPFLPKWQEYCTTTLSEPEHARWLAASEPYGVGVCLGEASGIIGTDFDYDVDGMHAKIMAILPDSPVKKKGAKGFTAFYRYNGQKSRSFKREVERDGKREMVAVVEILSTGRQTVLPPTLHPDGMQYVWLTEKTLENTPADELPVITNEQMMQLEALFAPPKAEGKTKAKRPAGHEKTKARTHCEHSLEEMTYALTFIPADDYDTWLDMGMAMHKTFGDAAKAVWAAWSRTCPKKYSEQEINKKWQSFDSDRDESITIGTLIYTAQQYGYKPYAGYTFEVFAERIDKADGSNHATFHAIVSLLAKSPLSEMEKERLLKLIKKKTGSSLDALKRDLRKAAGNVVAANHVEATSAFLEHIGRDNVIYARGRFHLWLERGVWIPVEDRALKQRVQQFLDPTGLNKAVLDSILDLLKNEIFQDVEFNAPCDSINTPAGELHLEGDQWVLKPHERERYQTIQIPVTYDPKADAPRFRQFLQEIFAGTEDAARRADLLCEYIGYSLSMNCRFEVCLFLIGGGANGKSVLLNVLTALAGEDNASAVQPENFARTFQRAAMVNKLVNIVTEIEQGARVNDAMFKALVSGEKTTLEHKFRDPFDARSYAKMWFATNHMPYVRDFSPAFFRRVMILSFPNKFEGTARDLRLTDTLKQELPGILNMALEGLKRLAHNGSFTYCPSSEQLKRGWWRQNDQVMAFIEEQCTLEKEASIASGTLYDAYSAWAQRNGFRSWLSHNNFSTALQLHGVVFHRGAQGTHYLRGIRLQNIEDML